MQEGKLFGLAQNFILLIALANGFHDLQIVGGFDKGFRVTTAAENFGNIFFIDAQKNSNGFPIVFGF